jgi:short-subunit dehydrogenase
MNEKKRALITGASGGIGRDMAEVFAAEGYDLVVVARTESKLQALADTVKQRYGTDVFVVPMDLAAPGAVDELFAVLEAQQVPVHTLINNAGFADYAPFHKAERRKLQNMMQLNMVALTDLTYLLLPQMVARGDGAVLNVASTAAFMPGPLMAVYYATKAYVLSFSEAIADELRDSGVTVMALCPGPTASGFQSTADMAQSRLVQNGLMDSMTVAREAYDALQDGKTVYVPGAKNKLQALLPRFLPRGLMPRVVRQAQAEVGR